MTTEIEYNKAEYQARAILENLTKAYNDSEMYEYFNDTLDINWLLNSDKTFKAVRLLVAFGGPNIWIDTETQMIEVYWWNDTFKLHIPSEIVEAIDEQFEEIFDC